MTGDAGYGIVLKGKIRRDSSPFFRRQFDPHWMGIGLWRIVMAAAGFDIVIKTQIHIPLPFRVQVTLITVILAEMDIGIGIDFWIHKGQLLTVPLPGKGGIAN